ncbi:MAG: hypothetical protein O7G84_00705, partial [Gammaproteobacteria bacterium]|nr:hypothetical protein [Gammaproteobacteria bacterium]
MNEEVIDRRDDLVIRRGILEPGETTAWHTDPCHRFATRGSRRVRECLFESGETTAWHTDPCHRFSVIV